MAGILDYANMVAQLNGGGLLGNVAMKNKPLDKGLNPANALEGAKPYYGGSGPFKGTVYHGTNTPFEKVDMQKGSMGTFWATSDKGAIARGDSGASGTKHTLAFEGNMKNPAGWKEYDKFSTGELISRGYDGVILPNKSGHFDAIFFHPSQLKPIK